jgi:hypothetical protein
LACDLRTAGEVRAAAAFAHSLIALDALYEEHVHDAQD